MTICYDLTSLSDNLSRIERYAACISQEMIRAHNDNFVLIFKREISPLFQDICQRDNVESIVLPPCNKLLFNQIRLPNAIRKIRADWFIFLAFPVPIFSLKRNMVEAIHDLTAWDYPETMNGIMNWYFRLSHDFAIKKCKAIITISEFSQKRIHERLNYPNEKIWLIYCGIDRDNFKPDKNKYETVREKYHLPERYILSLSTLEPRKNLPLLIHAYEQLIKEGKELLPLVMAGRKGWKMEELLASVDDMVKDKLYFTGFVDDEDLSEVYAMADFFAFPSIYEGFGIPPLEAMACGTPSISSDAASLPEVLGDSAIYFKSNDIADLKRALIETSTMTDGVKKELISKGLEQVELFDWKEEVEKLYSKLQDSN